eukprot:gnl/TRDRNA2_/TRDRNA2_169155_c1_seq3.p1 gnl/TRDRNA2_/TRDRNA2_169155_c1~~gnl/TRDRNA2_/TRDRNA2_169155_c1_seq3.p1  ORF type:complete len:222 (+),score=47.09 gnl/TRDRNA2_/TRDRNA2_169155_c1_seq3:113-778(+)
MRSITTYFVAAIGAHARIKAPDLRQEGASFPRQNEALEAFDDTTIWSKGFTEVGCSCHIDSAWLLRDGAASMRKLGELAEPPTKYEILGVPEDADERTIQKAYHKLSLKHHPDRGGSTEMMQEINDAMKTLLDRERREEYDAQLREESGFFDQIDEEAKAEADAIYEANQKEIEREMKWERMRKEREFAHTNCVNFALSWRREKKSWRDPFESREWIGSPK